MRRPPLLVDVAAQVRDVVERCDRAGLTLSDANVIDTLADHIDVIPRDTLRDALVISGHGARFPRATTFHRGEE